MCTLCVPDTTKIRPQNYKLAQKEGTNLMKQPGWFSGELWVAEETPLVQLLAWMAQQSNSEHTQGKRQLVRVIWISQEEERTRRIQALQSQAQEQLLRFGDRSWPVAHTTAASPSHSCIPSQLTPLKRKRELWTWFSRFFAVPQSVPCVLKDQFHRMKPKWTRNIAVLVNMNQFNRK